MILILFTDVYSPLNGFLTNQHNDQLPVGLLAQLIEHCIGIAEVMGSNPVQAWIFFRPYFHYCLVMFITAKIAFIYIHLLIRSLRIWFSYPQSFILRWHAVSSDYFMKSLPVGRIGNRTSERGERVRFLIQTDECVNTIRTDFPWFIMYRDSILA